MKTCNRVRADKPDTTMIIRQETPADYEAVYRLIEEAFAHAEHADGTEQELVVRLRRSRSFIPQLSLVAEEDGTVVGHILFTEARIGSKKVVALAPLAVLPPHQRKGIGRALIRTGHAVARESGFDCSIVLGDPRYYGRSGYEPADKYGIRPPFDVPSEYYLCCRLRETAPVSGVVRYANEFFL